MTYGIKRHQAGRNHYYTIDGARADGVTTLLSQGKPKNLTNWAARLVAEYVADADEQHLFNMRAAGREPFVNFLKGIPNGARNKAAVRGTEVHALAEQLITGASVEVPEALAGYVEAAAAFMDEWKPAPVLVEAVVASRTWNYAGTFDLVADLPDGRRVLFDYKTSASGIWPETAMQLAAYRNADVYLGDDGTEMPMREVGIDECAAVWLRADGYDLVPLVTEPFVFKAFLHVAQVARNIRGEKDWVLPAVRSPFLGEAA